MGEKEEAQGSEYTSGYTFIKFGKKEYMEKLFRYGNIYCNPLRGFNNEEAHENDHRYDKYEGIYDIKKLDPVDLIINGRVVAVSTKAELKLHYATNYPIYCMYGLKLKMNYMNHCNEIIAPEMYEIGKSDGGIDTAVIITKTDKFLKRIDYKMRQLGINYHQQNVKYTDDIYKEWGYFHKPKKFEYQKEYRFVLQKESNGVHFDFNIGSMKKIAMLVPVEHVHRIKIYIDNKGKGRTYIE